MKRDDVPSSDEKIIEYSIEFKERLKTEYSKIYNEMDIVTSSNESANYKLNILQGQLDILGYVENSIIEHAQGNSFNQFKKLVVGGAEKIDHYVYQSLPWSVVIFAPEGEVPFIVTLDNELKSS